MFSVLYATVYRLSNIPLHSGLVNEQSLWNGHSTVRPKVKEDDVALTKSSLKVKSLMLSLGRW